MTACRTRPLSQRKAIYNPGSNTKGAFITSPSQDGYELTESNRNTKRGEKSSDYVAFREKRHRAQNPMPKAVNFMINRDRNAGNAARSAAYRFNK